MQTKSDLHQSTLQIMTGARTACNDTTNQSPVYTIYQRGRIYDSNLQITNRAPVYSFKLDQYPTELQLKISRFSRFQETNLPPGIMGTFRKTGLTCLSTVLTVDDELQTVNIS